jgi:hypothetical protein
LADIKDEWSRVSENPDNVIISDSLRDLLDTSELVGPPPVATSVVTSCVIITNEGESIAGTLLSYRRGLEYTILTIAVGAESCLGLMSSSVRASSVDISNNVNNHTTSLDVLHKDIDLGIEFEYGMSSKMGASSAILSVTIPA